MKFSVNFITLITEYNPTIQTIAPDSAVGTVASKVYGNESTLRMYLP
jgi:hypothetical protein